MVDGAQNLTSQLSAEGRRSRVLVLSDVRIVRDGLVAALSDHSSQWVITARARLDEALKDVATNSADVVLLDMSMTGALDCARRIAFDAPQTSIVSFAAEDADATLIACVECGVVGFVPRDGSLNDLVTTIESALCGEAQLSPRLTVSLMRRLASMEGRSSKEAAAMLTHREQEILAMLGDGLSNKEIAARLIIEVATVKNHVHNILSKTQLRRRTEAAALLRKWPRSHH